MRLTVYSDYALRVLIYLSIQDDRLATIKEISTQYDISRNHLMKLVHDLGKHGYIETIRGKNGGLRIGRDPAKITVGEVVRAMEKDMSIVECFTPGNGGCQTVEFEVSGCMIVQSCVLAGVMRQALKVFLEVLDDYTIEDLIKPKAELINAFPIDVWSGTPPPIVK